MTDLAPESETVMEEEQEEEEEEEEEDEGGYLDARESCRRNLMNVVIFICGLGFLIGLIGFIVHASLVDVNFERPTHPPLEVTFEEAEALVSKMSQMEVADWPSWYISWVSISSRYRNAPLSDKTVKLRKVLYRHYVDDLRAFYLVDFIYSGGAYAPNNLKDPMKQRLLNVKIQRSWLARIIYHYLIFCMKFAVQFIILMLVMLKIFVYLVLVIHDSMLELGGLVADFFNN